MVASICCGLAAFGKFFPIVYLVAIAFYLIYAIRLFFIKDGVKDWIVKYRTLKFGRKYASDQTLYRTGKRVFWIAYY